MARITGKKRGFTLVELMVVLVGIIAALAVVVIPNVAQFYGSGSSRLEATRAAIETTSPSPAAPVEIPALMPQATNAPVIFGAPESPPTATPVPAVRPTRAPEAATDDKVPVPTSNGGSQVCQDYLFAGRPAPDVSPGFYVERIVCLTPEGYLEPVDHPTDLPGLQALAEALRMELLASKRLAEVRLAELNRLVNTREGEAVFHPVVYVEEENP